MVEFEKPTGYFGRDDEWKRIRECITDEGRSRCLICVSGPGGVGKTALLDSLHETYATQSDSYIVPNVVDFDDLTLRLPVNFMRRIINLVGTGKGEEAFRHIWELPEEDTDSDLVRLRSYQEKAKDAFVARLNELATKKRTVLLIDTLEKSPIWFPTFFADVASRLQNLVVVLVGRPQGNWIERLSEESYLPAFRKEFFKWSGLPSSLCEEYFQGRKEFEQLAADLELLGIEISSDLKDRIWTLAQGIPFQVNLVFGVLRYLGSGDPALNRQAQELLDEIQRVKAADLEDDLVLQQRFQQALVAPLVQNFNRPKPSAQVDYLRLTSRIIMLIAHVNHYMAHALGGFDASLLASLDDTLDDRDVQLGLDHIEKNRETHYTFVKLFRGPQDKISGIGLHDEMVRMLNEFAWTRIDPPGHSEPLRKTISKELVRYYDQKCLELARKKDQEQPSPRIWAQIVKSPEGQALLLARIFHSLYVNLQEGWDWAYTLSDRIFMRTEFDALLHDSVAAYIQATPNMKEDVIQAKMNVWKAGAHIARDELPQARALLNQSITVWTEWERGRDTLERSRRDLMPRGRELQLGQLTLVVQETVDALAARLNNMDRLIPPAKLFKDLERAYVSLGFTYRLDGKWEQAIKNYEDALRYSRLLRDRESVAELTNNIANVYLLREQLTIALLYGRIGASIRERLGTEKELGHSHFILGKINWRIGNTYESRMYLNKARAYYHDDPVALAQLDSYEGYTYYRIGDTMISRESLESIPGFSGLVPPMRSYQLLNQAREVFEQYERRDDLAETYNVLSRAYRRDDEFEEAEEAALKVLELTKNRLRVAEAHLSLCMLYYRWGLKRRRGGDKAGAMEEFRKVENHYELGSKLAREDQLVTLLSVYEGVKGNIEYERGADNPDHYAVAFRHYSHECRIAAENKPLRFERALNEVVADRLARMPVDLAMKYADVLIDREEEWQNAGLEREYEKLRDEVDELKKFLGVPERKLIDEMENRFNRHMRAGDYRDALNEARQSLEQFYRYNWSIDTVRVLLKTAQAYRKVAKYTAARRYCKQALLIVDNLLQHDEHDILLITQQAHAHFTMGRILWEIGNTAEAATHFRLARESYLQYRDHPDERSAAEMRQGLARSVQYEGLLRFRIGEWNHSLQFLDWAEQKYRDGRNYRRTAKLLNIKARIYRDRNEEGDIRRAREALNEALRILGEVGDKYATAESYLTYMILEYQEYRENRSQGHRQAEEHLKKAQEWYEKGAKIAHENSYILLQAVYEGMLGNVLFDQLMEENRRDGEFRLEPAFDRYLEECWWGAHFEKRRFFRSLDLLIQRLSLLNASEIRHYIRYIRQKWEQLARGGRLPSQDGSKGDRENLVLAAEYVTDMQNFCDLVEEFSEDIAS